MMGIKQIPSLFRIAAIAGGNVSMPAWSLAGPLSLKRRGDAGSHSHTDQCSCGLSDHESAYNEEAFHYLLELERKRFELSNKPFVLMLVDLEGRAGHTARIDAVLGAQVFSGLARSLRDTDVIGWYRDGRIAGAVLTHLGDASIAEVSRLMAERVTGTLREELPRTIARRLRVRLYQPLASTQP